ncbi:MAG TPA: matrixin family metalloprotease [Myxococcota bacterium]|jgi:hypothetical protein
MRVPRLLTVVALLAAVPALAYDQPFKLIDGGAWDLEAGPIPYVLAPDGVDDISDGSDLEAIRGAFRAWSCVEGTKLRFEEQPGPGPAVQDESDGQNTLFWDEDNTYQLGPATLGVTIGDATPGQKRKQADIIFNGFDSKWSTDDIPSNVDVGSIALHEIGHFVGLDHPCDGSAPNETNCNGADKSVMTPVWGGAVARTPLPDDEEGIRNMYPIEKGDVSSCTGPFRKGERCGCDGDCVPGLVCVDDGGDKKVCGGTCAADNADCGAGFVCALNAPEGSKKAQGICVKVTAGQSPQGAICTNEHECASGSCALIFDLTRQVCEVPCGSDKDCGADGQCFEHFCLGAATHDQCPDKDAPKGCGCGALSASDAAASALLLGGLLAWRRRRRAAPGFAG